MSDNRKIVNFETVSVGKKNGKNNDGTYVGENFVVVVDGVNVMGCQIQIADVYLEDGQAHVGEIIYGRGNCGDGREGARSGNIVFTSCLGPVMVKNPKLAEKWLSEAAEAAGVEVGKSITDDEVDIQNKSYDLINKFIENKVKGQQN